MKKEADETAQVQIDVDPRQATIQKIKREKELARWRNLGAHNSMYKEQLKEGSYVKSK